jgi:hypothetical protein
MQPSNETKMNSPRSKMRGEFINSGCSIRSLYNQVFLLSEPISVSLNRKYGVRQRHEPRKNGNIANRKSPKLSYLGFS